MRMLKMAQSSTAEEMARLRMTVESHRAEDQEQRMFVAGLGKGLDRATKQADASASSVSAFFKRLAAMEAAMEVRVARVEAQHEEEQQRREETLFLLAS
mmetsp:Transcript_102/g.357  ORF Transcript_102/g.357 Transcript_102/m.357 type:complete len:99 (-) Transcript_102:222-518(-)